MSFPSRPEVLMLVASGDQDRWDKQKTEEVFFFCRRKRYIVYINCFEGEERKHYQESSAFFRSSLPWDPRMMF